MKCDIGEYQREIERFLQEYSQPLSSYAFANIFSWQGHFRFYCEKIQDSLCVFAQDTAGTFLYLSPLCRRITPALAEACFHRLESCGPRNPVARIENVGLAQVSSFDFSAFDLFRKDDECGYSRTDVAGLRGNAYKSQRNAYNVFIKNYSCQCLPYEPSMADECLALYERWAKDRREKHDDEIYRQMLADARSVHELVLRYADKIGVTGWVVVVGNEISGYTFGYPLGKKVFCVYLEVADVAKKGLPVFLFREFCAAPEIKPFDFINVMDSFGMREVQQTKQSFKPSILWPVYVVTKKKKPEA